MVTCDHIFFGFIGILVLETKFPRIVQIALFCVFIVITLKILMQLREPKVNILLQLWYKDIIQHNANRHMPLSVVIKVANHSAAHCA